MRALGASRTSVATGGVLAGNWARDPLWKNARAVPSLDLRFAENKSLTDVKTGASLVTFTRASSATYVGSDGVVKSATTNEARFDHNPTTGESLGLLVEEARTNLQGNSEVLTAASWLTTSATVAGSSTVGPNGQTAYEITENTNANAHNFTGGGAAASSTTSIVSGSIYTGSVFLKKSTVDWVQLAFGAGGFGSTYFANFNLDTGVIGNTGGSVTAQMVPYANGWYRCIMTAAATVTSVVSNNLICAFTNNTNATSRLPSYTGSTANKVFAFMAQFELGSFVSSYIPTIGSVTVTRAADVASIGSSAFTSFYNQAAQTWFGEYAPVYNASATVPANTPHLFQVYNTAVNTNNYAIRGAQNTTSQGFIARNPTFGLQSLANAGVGFGVAGLNRKVSFGIDSSTLNFATNGSIGTDANNVAASMATHDILSIGSGTGGSPFQQLSGTIKRLSFWPTRLSNSIIQAITQ